MLKRRTFVLASGLAASGTGAPADRIRCGTIVTGGRGTYLTAQFREHGAEMAAVCDVYERHLENGLRAASPGAVMHYDYRRLLDDKTLDAVIIATPDHLHAQMLIDAVE